MPVNAVNLPFREQAEFLRRKLNVPTESWIDIYNQQHDWAFVVAGANRDALVADFRRAVEQVIEDGITLEQFREQFDRIVVRNGWSYNGGRNWRSRVIYDTNLNSSYQAGRYEQLLAVRERRPYWMYVHNDAVEHPRPHHRAWNNMILRWDNPWWQYHFPPGGWGCQCRVIALSDADLRRMGRTVDTAPEINWVEREIGKRSPGGPFTVRVPEGIDPSFEHIPGRSRLEGSTPPHAPMPPPMPPTPPPPLPAPRPGPGTLPSTASAVDLARAFLGPFNAASASQVFRDVLDNSMVVGPRMLQDFRPALFAYAPAFASALQAPGEIWLRSQFDRATGRAVVRRAYVAPLLIDNAEQTVAVDMGRDGWGAAVGDAAQLYRQGALIYSAGAEQ